MAAQYVYEKHLPKDSIRLLKITSDGENFHGMLEEFKIERLPYFSAISWCWTSRRETKSMTFSCNGKPFPVSGHLYALLANLNPQGVPSSLTIWLDAICINQNHAEEKGVHVPRMSKVYGKAHSMIAWLGDSEHDSDLVMNSQTVAALNDKLVAFPTYTSSDEVAQYGLPETTDPIWGAIGRLLERDWFYRTWIVQEVALARKVDMLCGSEWLEWDSLITLVNAISRTGLSTLCRNPQGPVSTRPNGIGVLLDLFYTRKAHLDGGCSIDYLLRMVRLREVTKPIDKVYGMFALLDKGVRNVVTVDYAKLESQYWRVYLDVVKHIIRTNDHSFWLLSMAPSAERPEHLPTWVPNLNSTIPEILDFSSMNWNAGTLRDGPRTAGISAAPDSPNIKVAGFVMDEVQEVVQLGSPTPAPNKHGELSLDTMTTEFLERNTECTILSQRTYPNPGEALRAQSCTLIVNTWENFQPIMPSQHEEACQRYLDTVTYLSSGRNQEPTIAVGSIGRAQEPATNTDPTIERRRDNMHRYLRQLGWWTKRPFFTTTNGRIGRGAANIKAGDLLCVFHGAGPVFVLRPGPRDEGVHELVGDAYLHGCMELKNVPPGKRGEEREFVII